MPKGEDNSDFHVGKVEQRVLDDIAYFKLWSKPDTATLARFAVSDDILERYVAASSPDTPVESLARLAKDKAIMVRMLVAANPSSTLEILMRVVASRHTHPPTERNLGLHPLANDELFAAMLAPGRRRLYETMVAVATAPDLTDARVAMLIREGGMTAYIAERADLSPTGMMMLAEAEALAACYCLARRRDLPADVAAMLAVNEHAEIREQLLTNPNVDRGIIVLLSDDEDDRIVELANHRLDTGEIIVPPAEVATWRYWTIDYGFGTYRYAS